MLSFEWSLFLSSIIYIRISGARVILACRDITKAERAAESIRKSSGNSHVVVHKLDLASLNSVRTFAKRIKSSEPHLNILINNAGEK